jgi:hypothetical protein
MNERQFDALTEALLEKEYLVIDILPRQVSAERGAAYFAAERYFLDPPRLHALYERFAVLLVKLSCYFDLALCANEVWTASPAPRELWARVTACADSGWCNVLLPEEKALITLYAGDLYMTLYHPSEELAQTVRQLAAAQGLFVRAGE